MTIFLENMNWRYVQELGECWAQTKKEQFMQWLEYEENPFTISEEQRERLKTYRFDEDLLIKRRGMNIFYIESYDILSKTPVTPKIGVSTPNTCCFPLNSPKNEVISYAKPYIDKSKRIEIVKLEKSRREANICSK